MGLFLAIHSLGFHEIWRKTVLKDVNDVRKRSINKNLKFNRANFKKFKKRQTVNNFVITFLTEVHFPISLAGKLWEKLMSEFCINTQNDI